jgi:hypothetical protein
MQKLFFWLLIFLSACTLPEEKQSNQLSKKSGTTVIQTNDANSAIIDTLNVVPLPVIKKVNPPNGIYRTVLPMNGTMEQTVAFNKDFTYQLQEKYNNNKTDSIVITEGTWAPSDGAIWLYKDQVMRGRYNWKGEDLQYFSPLYKKYFSMHSLHDVMDDQLAAGPAQDAGHAVNHQQHAGVPNLNRIGEKENAPGERHRGIHQLRDLDHPPAIVAVRQSAEVNREEQERRPVTDHGKASQHRRVKFLKQHPVTDHMLDVIAHLRHHDNKKISAIIRMVQRRKGDTARRFGGFVSGACWNSHCSNLVGVDLRVGPAEGQFFNLF